MLYFIASKAFIWPHLNFQIIANSIIIMRPSLKYSSHNEHLLTDNMKKKISEKPK